MKNIIIAIFIAALFYTLYFMGSYPQALYYVDMAYQYIGKSLSYAGSNIAAVLLRNPVTVADLHNKYNSVPVKKVRVLIIPGHEPDLGGTEYRDLKERNMNVELARELGNFLKNNGHYDVILARDEKIWSPALMDYFKNNWSEIIEFLKDNREATLRQVKEGETVKYVSKMQHNKAPADVALRLYGINKWETENDIDIAIHVHFNDVPRSSRHQPGKYSGFAIYIPEPQFAHSFTTRAVAENVFKRLEKYNAVSNLPAEDEGLVEGSELIAIGANNTTNSASMLIEYGYIYEPQFQNSEVRSKVLKDMAFQTYLGLQDFFGQGNDVSFAYDTLMLPHSWKDELTVSKGGISDVLALQSALLLDGVYPGEGRTKNDCPRTGKIGPCTLGAIEAFQKKNGIKRERGIVGEMTRNVLNQKYSVKGF
ncbi:MAG: N-acetylmuramoyl-L-alanine amidase [bacterium]|nr:N-acetylmuramoyl-L-alanine amidase [bacterium]